MTKTISDFNKALTASKGIFETKADFIRALPDQSSPVLYAIEISPNDKTEAIGRRMKMVSENKEELRIMKIATLGGTVTAFCFYENGKEGGNEEVAV